MDYTVFKTKILTKSSIEVANASLFEILYYIWFGLSSDNQWTSAGPYLLSGGHKYLVSPDMGGNNHVWEDHVDISSYPYPTGDVAAVYYRQWDEQSRSYKITVCP